MTTSTTARKFAFLKATSAAFSGEKDLATYKCTKTGLYLAAYQLCVGSIDPQTRGMLTEFQINGNAIANTHMRNYMPGQGSAGAMIDMSCVWVGKLTNGQTLSCAGLAESGKMEVQFGSMAVVELPDILNVS